MSKKNEETKFNEQQQEAIDSRKVSTIVSASAGTGKTTVMIERLFQMIKQDKVDLSNVVVVTFTKLAANSMRRKLLEALEEHSSDPVVFKQLEKIDSCAISTLHSFCGMLLRNYFHVVDIDPDFTMLDDYALNNLKNQCLKEVLDKYYKADDALFDKLYKIYATNRKDTNLVKEVLGLYEKSRTHVNFYKWHQQMRQDCLNFKGSRLEADFNVYLQKTLTDLRNQWLNCAALGSQFDLDFYVKACQQRANLCSASPNNTFEQNFVIVNDAIQNFNKDDAKIPRGGTNVWKKVDKEIEKMLIAKFQAVAEDCEKNFATFIDYEQGLTYDQLVKQSAEVVEYIDKFFEILQQFDQVFAQAKREKGVVDFSDLEHFALAILKDEKCRSEIQEQYKYIFVDEHQDTNPLQAEIIKQLVPTEKECEQKTEHVLFLVGDVKQSIYGFRGCTPNNFVESIKEFATDENRKYVELNQNYRSHTQILDFVNTLMKGVMTEDFGKIDYEKTSMFKGYRDIRVVKPNDTNRDELPPVLIDVFSLPKTNVALRPDDIYDITNAPHGQDEKIKAEAMAIAHRIKHLVGSKYIDYKVKLPDNYVEQEGKEDPRTKTITYKDIVILSRSRGEYPLAIYNQLLGEQIPVVGSFKMKGLNNKEVRMLISLLRVIDNPHSDIAFVGLLLSCFCNLTEEQIATIKIDTQFFKGSFYNRVLHYIQSEKANEEIKQKVTTLLAQVEKYRLFSYGATVDQVLLEAIASTNYHLYVRGMQNAGLRVRKMYDFIDQIKDKQYSQSIDKFLQFLDETSFDGELDEASSQESAVKFMTMHASKGLEFPVVIFIGGTNQFNNDTDTLIYDAEYGTAYDTYNFDTRLKTSSLVAKAIKALKHKGELSEELRLLYVALTRAQNHLIITIPQDPEDRNSYDEELQGKKSIQNVNSYKNWLLRAIGKNVKWEDGSQNNGVMVTFMDDEEYAKVPTDLQSHSATQCDNLDIALQNLSYVYPYSQQVVPSKLTSSTLDAHRFELKDDQEENGFTWQPLTTETDKMQLGSAYHKVYETINYNATVQQIEQHLQDLVNQRLIEESVAQSMDVNLISQTLSNPTFQQIVNSGKVYHEVPFLTQTEYSRFVQDGSDALTLLQGIIDLLVVGESKATIVDFKYTSNSYNLANRYQKQLQSYRYAVEEVLKLPVDCYLLSIADNKLIKID